MKRSGQHLLFLMICYTTLLVGCGDQDDQGPDYAGSEGGREVEGGEVDSGEAGGSEMMGGETMGGETMGGEMVGGEEGGAMLGGEAGGEAIGGEVAGNENILWTQVDLAWEHGCGVDSEGSAKCWGRGDQGQLAVPHPSEGVLWKRVSVGRAHACLEGVRQHTEEEVQDLEYQCWGRGDEGQLEIPTEWDGLHHITAGWKETCGLDRLGQIHCWGDLDPTRPPPTEAGFKTLELGQSFGCALSEDTGQLTCWGRNEYGQASPPSGEGYTSLSVGTGRHACAINREGRAQCWGDSSAGRTLAPAIQFSQISVGRDHACGLDVMNGVKCWGVDLHGQASAPVGTFIWVSAGPTFTCGLRTEGTLSCWGGLSEPVAPLFSTVSVGKAHSCAVKVDGSLSCWGWPRAGRTTPPQGQFSDVAVGDEHSCALSVDGQVMCWGVGIDPNRFERDGDFDQASPPTTFEMNTLLMVKAGALHTCVLSDMGQATCWGDHRFGQTNLPADTGVLTDLALGRAHSCALQEEGTVICWGDDTKGQSTPPEGSEFVKISAGGDASCALDREGKATCWGHLGSLDVPTQTVDLLQLGEETLCYRQVGETQTRCVHPFEAPTEFRLAEEVLQLVATGTGAACALKADQRLTCSGQHAPTLGINLNP